MPLSTKDSSTLNGAYGHLSLCERYYHNAVDAAEAVSDRALAINQTIATIAESAEMFEGGNNLLADEIDQGLAESGACVAQAEAQSAQTGGDNELTMSVRGIADRIEELRQAGFLEQAERLLGHLATAHDALADLSAKMRGGAEVIQERHGVIKKVASDTIAHRERIRGIQGPQELRWTQW